MRLVITIVLCGIPAVAIGQQAATTGATPPSFQVARALNSDRSPVAVAVADGGRLCATANRDAGSVSLVDLARGRVLDECPVGAEPSNLLWLDSARLVVSVSGDGRIMLVRKTENRLEVEASIAVGRQPRGLALLPDSNHSMLAVALAGSDELAVVDLSSQSVSRRIPVGGLPDQLAVSPDGRFLVTCCSVPGECFVHDARTLAPLSRRRIFDDAFNPGVPVIPHDSSCCIIPSAVNRTFPVTLDNIERGWVIDQRISKLPLPDGDYWEQQQMGLDERGRASADIYGAALSADGRLLALACGGSHEILVLNYPTLPWPTGNPPDFLPDELQLEPTRFKRIDLGGRPRQLQFFDAAHLVVANVLRNSLQIVDAEAGTLLREIPLGGPAEPSLARRGEIIFHDAQRSFHQWFSCHTCHPDGHTCGQRFDTINDGNYDTAKLVPSLRGVARTGPWTWHGWQTSLQAAMRKSLVDTLQTEKPVSDDDVRALVAYMETLDHPRPATNVSDQNDTDADRLARRDRGRALFLGKADCVSCHAGADFTSAATYEIGTAMARYEYDGLNPPSLRGVRDRRRFLHDGRAQSLDEVLERYHRPGTLAGEELTSDELQDLIAWLQSL